MPMDLRVLYEARVFETIETEKPPIADKLGLNSTYAYSLLKKSHYPIEGIARVEALRYCNLLGRYGSERKEKKVSGQTLLVATGPLDYEAKFQLRLLNEAANQNGLTDYRKIIVKFHPDLSGEAILESIKPQFKFTLTSQPLNELWSISDTIYCSYSTTVSIEAGYLGIPVIITGPENSMNLNPLYGLSSINFVTDSKMLCEKLKNPTEINIPEDYFYLDNKMTLWKKLLHDQKTA